MCINRVAAQLFLINMNRKFSTSNVLSHTFEYKEIKIRIVDRFLFVEADQRYGLKGVNYFTKKYKHCIRLRRSIGIDKLKAFYDGKILRVTVNEDQIEDENELLIDKRLAMKKKKAPIVPVVDRMLEGNYERFMVALKEIGMI